MLTRARELRGELGVPLLLRRFVSSTSSVPGNSKSLVIIVLEPPGLLAPPLLDYFINSFLQLFLLLILTGPPTYRAMGFRAVVTLTDIDLSRISWRLHRLLFLQPLLLIFGNRYSRIGLLWHFPSLNPRWRRDGLT